MRSKSYLLRVLPGVACCLSRFECFPHTPGLSNVIGVDNAEDRKSGVRSSDICMQVGEKAVTPIVLEYLNLICDRLTDRIEGFPVRPIIALPDATKKNLDAPNLETFVHH